MTTDEIMKKIREGLTGEYSVDMVYLESQADKYRSAKNAKEIGSAIADLAYEILPDDKREVLNKMMYIDGKRLDVVFAEANKLIQEKKIETAAELLVGTARPVEQIMSEVGYSDKKHFYELFYKSFGMTPGEYRQKPKP